MRAGLLADLARLLMMPGVVMGSLLIVGFGLRLRLGVDWTRSAGGQFVRIALTQMIVGCAVFGALLMAMTNGTR